MDMREMIEAATTKVGEQKALAARLGVHPNNLTNAKRGERGLPDEACMKLSEILNVSFAEVIAARNYATAKNEETRAFWSPFFRHAAGIMGVAVLSGAALPPSSEAAQDAGLRALPSRTMYIMSNSTLRRFRRFGRFGRFINMLKKSIFQPMTFGYAAL